MIVYLLIILLCVGALQLLWVEGVLFSSQCMCLVRAVIRNVSNCLEKMSEPLNRDLPKCLKITGCYVILSF